MQILITTSFKFVQSCSVNQKTAIYTAMNSYNEHHLVNQCLREIEGILMWGTSEDWHNEVFNELSERIQEKTNVLLSPTTLKRVWGKVQYNSAPSITTLNVLAQFAGYDNWRHYKSTAGPSSTKKTKPIGKNHAVIISSAAFLTLLFISIFSMIGSRNTIIEADYSNVSFSSRTVSEGYPNSVVFDLDLHSIESDNIKIQQFWDPNKTIQVKASQSEATGIYYYPGYFRAKLLVDNAIVLEHDLFLKASDWMATLDYEPVPKYLTSAEFSNGTLQLPEEYLEELSSSQDPLRTTFHLVRDMSNISADKFTLRSTIQNSYSEKWAVCQSTQIIILGTKGAIIIPLSIPGCVSDIGVMLNDVFLDGKENDLSALGTSLSEATDIEIQTDNNVAKLFINGQLAFEHSYNEPIGRFVGLRYRFLGAGTVHNSTVIDPISGESMNML